MKDLTSEDYRFLTCDSFRAFQQASKAFKIEFHVKYDSISERTELHDSGSTQLSFRLKCRGKDTESNQINKSSVSVCVIEGAQFAEIE